MSNREIAEKVGRSESWVRALLNGHRGASPDELTALSTSVLPPFQQSFSERHRHFSSWLNQLPRPASGVSWGQPLERPRHHVGLDGLTLVGQSADPAALTRGLEKLVGRGAGWFVFERHTPTGRATFCLRRSGEDHLAPERKPYPGFRHVLNVGLVRPHPRGPVVLLVAKLRYGATRARCPAHRRVRGEHKRGGSWAADCLWEQQGVRCPSDHYLRVPRRCGQCTYPDTDYRQCPACRKANGEGCPTCAQLTSGRPHLLLQLTGAAFRLGVFVHLLQHLFARLVLPHTVVRRSVHLALDLELPYIAVLPFQRSDSLCAPLRPFGVVRHIRNEDRPPGLVFGAAGRLVAYDKLAEHAERLEEQVDPTLALPAHMAGWQPGAGTRLEFRSPDRSQPGQAHSLGDLRKDWLSFALADLTRLQPGTPLCELALEAKLMGFLAHHADRARAAARSPVYSTAPTLASPRPRYEAIDLVDALVLAQGGARDAVPVADSLAAALYAELLRVQHPFQVGQAVEQALPDLEAQLREGLLASSGPPSAPLAAGRRQAEPPGLVVWEEQRRMRAIAAEAEACREDGR